MEGSARSSGLRSRRLSRPSEFPKGGIPYVVERVADEPTIGLRETWAGASADGITASAGEQDLCVEMSPYLQLPCISELQWASDTSEERLGKGSKVSSSILMRSVTRGIETSKASAACFAGGTA